jgi:hypothetical protein
MHVVDVNGVGMYLVHGVGHARFGHAGCEHAQHERAQRGRTQCEHARCGCAITARVFTVWACTM